MDQCNTKRIQTNVIMVLLPTHPMGLFRILFLTSVRPVFINSDEFRRSMHPTPKKYLIFQFSKRRLCRLTIRRRLDSFSRLSSLCHFLQFKHAVLAKMKSCFEDLRSKTFQWGKKGLWSKKRTKKGPVIELLRTFSRYFRNNAERS